MGYESIRDAVVAGLTGHGFVVPVAADNWNFVDVLIKEIYEQASIEEHALVGARHTVSGLVPDQVLRALTADTFAFRSLDDLYYPRDDVDALLAAQDELSEMGDVVITGVTDEELLVYDTDTSKWINQTRTEAELAGIKDTATIEGLWTFSRGSANPPFAVLPSDAAYVQYLDADKVDGLHAEQFARSDVSDTITGNWQMVSAGQIQFRASSQAIWSSGTGVLDTKAGTTLNWVIGSTTEMHLDATELKLDDARIHMNNHDIYDIGDLIWRQYIAPSTYTTTLTTLAVLGHPGFQMEAVKSGYTATGLFSIQNRSIDSVEQHIWVFSPGLYVYDAGPGTGNIYAVGQLVTLYGGGGAPIKVVNSTNLCTNLNADRLDSQHGAYYLDPTNMSGAVRGSILRSNAVPAWEVYALGTTGYILRSDGSDITWTSTFTADMTFSGNVKAVFNDVNKYVHWDSTDIAFVTDSGDFKFSGGDVVVSGQMIVQHDGTEPSWGHSPTGLAIEGTSEFDGVSSFDAHVVIFDTARLTFADSLGSAGTIFVADYTADQFLVAVGAGVGRQFVLGEYAYRSRNFYHAVQTNPAFFVQGPSDPNNDSSRWWSIEFDETTDNERAIYNVGSGRHEFQYQGNRILTVTRYNSVETRLEFDQDDIFAIDTTLDMRLHPIQNVDWMAIATIYDVTHNDPVRIPKGIELDEITEPAAPDANRLRLFAKDDGGKTALYVRFPSGASQLVLVEV